MSTSSLVTAELPVTSELIVDATLADSNANRSSSGGGSHEKPVVAIADPREDAVDLVGTVTLTDRSTYHGEVDADGVPNDIGVLLSVFGSTYAGAIKDSKKHGVGVELNPNGSIYSGEFCAGVASGYGVYVGACADEYIGQWENGARHGVGVHVDADAVMSVMRFKMDEPVVQDVEEDADASNLSWKEDVQVHVLRAVLAEKEGVRNQESARQRHIEAVLQEMTTIGSETFNTPEETLAFETKEQLELAEFISDQSNQIWDVDAEASELKFAEAQLIQRQKELRADITSRLKELDCVAKYIALAETRAAQVQEAERTLNTLQWRLDLLHRPANALASERESGNSAAACSACGDETP